MSGDKPSKGEFLKYHLRGEGYKIRDISFIVDMHKEEHGGVRLKFRRYMQDRGEFGSGQESMNQNFKMSDCSYGLQALFYGAYSGIEAKVNIDENSRLGCSSDAFSGNDRTSFGHETAYESIILLETTAFRMDIDQFGGSHLDLARVGFLLKEFQKLACKFLDAQSTGNNDLDYDDFVCIYDVFGELDFAPRNSDLPLATGIAKLMMTHFGNAQRSQCVFSSGL